jgi:hypothetical protein
MEILEKLRIKTGLRSIINKINEAGILIFRISVHSEIFRL